jgi:RNA polymerase sigma-70 factor (ECF subfamily)
MGTPVRHSMESDILQNQFTKLYQEESDAIYRFCFLRVSDKEVALDLTQDTFTRFWDVISRGGAAIQNARAFLFTIARNSIIDWYRKKKSLSLDALTEETGDAETFAKHAGRGDIEMEHEGAYLMEKMRDLDPMYQQIVYLRFVEGLGPKDIAGIIGETENVVSVRLHRGIKQLRTIAGYDEKEV